MSYFHLTAPEVLDGAFPPLHLLRRALLCRIAYPATYLFEFSILDGDHVQLNTSQIFNTVSLQPPRLIWAAFPTHVEDPIWLQATNDVLDVVNVISAIADGIQLAAAGAELLATFAVLTGVGAPVVVALAPLIAALTAAAVMSAPVRLIANQAQMILQDFKTTLENRINSLISFVASFTPEINRSRWEPSPLPLDVPAYTVRALQIFGIPGGMNTSTAEGIIQSVMSGENTFDRLTLVWVLGAILPILTVGFNRTIRHCFHIPQLS